MLSKTKTSQKSSRKTLYTAVGAWLMAGATMIGMASLGREPRAIVNVAKPAYMATSDVSNVWSRNDNENETVHMPGKFDIGLRMPGVAGRL